jgi:prepilin-type N-terminal cleavage/methylation domain-containing protein
MKTLNLKNDNRKFSRGFTLIELLLYVSISSIILLVSIFFLQTLLESRIKNQTIAEVEQQGLQIMQLITQTIRNSDSINSPALGVSATSLSVNTITGGLNPTVFDLSGGVVRIKEGSAAVVPLTNSRITVSALSFFNLSRMGTPGSVRIQFTINYVNSVGRNEYSFTKTFISSATLRQP